MTHANLATILGEPKSDIISTLHSLHSVLDVPEEETRPICLLHPSFRDFLLNPARCLNQTFLVDARATHHHLLNCCLRLMKNHLRRNMCNLERPGIRAHDLAKADVDKFIPLPIQYACRYWIHHLQQSNIEPTEHLGIIDFFQTQFLFWLESLALISRLSDGIIMVRLLEAMLAVGGPYLLNATPILINRRGAMLLDVVPYFLGLQKNGDRNFPMMLPRLYISYYTMRSDFY